MISLQERARYETDAGVLWSRVTLLLGGAGLAATGIAWLLKAAYMHDWYLIILLPTFAGAALGGVLYLLVDRAHCRNRWLAAAVGMTAGLVAYLGYYQFCMMAQLPPAMAGIDMLPRYIAFRMRTDVAEDVGKANLRQQPKQPSVGLNWYAFTFELLIVAAWPAVLAWKRAGHAYSPDLGQWLRREQALLPPHASKSLGEAIETGQLAEFLASTPAGGNPETACRLTLEYTAPQDGSTLDCPVYASVEDIPSPRPWYWPSRVRRTVLCQVELEVAEVLALRPLFPKLTALLKTQHAELEDAPAHVLPSAASTGARATEYAEITPVPDAFRQRVRSKGYALWVNLIGLTPGLWFLGGIGVAGLGAWIISDGALPLGIAAVVLGLGGFGWGTYSALYCLAVPENRWIDRRLRREISQRPDSPVDPKGPDAVYVSLIPRESFAKVQLTMASDVLLLLIDERRRLLLLEGDADRYRIPAGAISVCEAQCFFHPIDQQQQTQLWMVRLMIQFEQGLQELLLSVNHTRWSPMTNARRKRVAEEMCARIRALGALPDRSN